MTVMAAEAGAGAAEAGAAESSAGARRATRQQSFASTAAGARDRAPSRKMARTSYQTVILAEFVGAVVLVAATPFAKKDSPGISPYVATDMVQLLAVGGVYFILALISGASPRAGRLSAWFGALILVTVGLGEAARLAKLLNVFGLQAPPDPGQQQLNEASGGQPA